MSVYFETSAINFLASNVDINTILKLKIGLEMKFGPIYMSPIAVWEIMCTKRDVDKDCLIEVCQNLFDKAMIYPSPIRTLDNFISKGCPLEETREDFFDKETILARVWNEICGDDKKTLIMQGEILDEDRAYMARISKLLRNLIKNNFDIEAENADPYYAVACDLINTVFWRITFIQEMISDGEMTPKHCLLFKTAIFFAVALLVLGVYFDYDEFESFWSKRMDGGSVEDKINYLFPDHELIICRGPLVYMAYMAIHQARVPSNRGLYKDCLHASYFPYSYMFFTRDKHFWALDNPDLRMYTSRVFSIEEFLKNISS